MEQGHTHTFQSLYFLKLLSEELTSPTHEIYQYTQHGQPQPCVGRPAAESLRGGTGVRVGRGGRGRRPKKGNDECLDDLNGQGNDQGVGANEGIEGVNRNVKGANRGAPDFSTIIAQQLQNLLPVMLAQVGNQNGNLVNENIQENIRNVLVNGNQ
nr:hypothetical protein [Tanacetum cinerariifolium]